MLSHTYEICELFAGLGGFRLGLTRASDKFKCVYTNQWEPNARHQWAYDCYADHFGAGREDSCSDIALVNKATIPDHKLLVGGFPCQDYSVANSNAQGIEGKKGVLWWSIVEVIKAKHPPFILLENVDRLLTSPSTQRGRDFGIILATLARQDYDVQWRVINAAEYGAPQRRRRIFILAYNRDTKYKKGLPTDAAEILQTAGFFSVTFPIAAITATRTTRLDHNDLVALSEQFCFNFSNSGILRDQSLTTADVRPAIEHVITPLSALLIPNAPIEYDLTAVQIDAFFKIKQAKAVSRKKSNGYKYVYREGAVPFPDPSNRPARTILTSEGTVSRTSHVVRDPGNGRLRFLTPEECEKIQMFPIGWTAGMPKRMRYFTIGNALVVDLITRMGRTLADILQHE